jgi:hypothetical protein
MKNGLGARPGTILITGGSRGIGRAIGLFFPSWNLAPAIRSVAP